MDDKQLQKLVKSPKVVFYEETADNIFHIHLREVGDVMEIPHYHNSFEFLCVTNGEIDVHIGEDTKRLTTGEIVCVTSLQIHCYERLEGFKGISLVVSEEYLRSFMKIYPDLFFPTFLLKSEEKIIIIDNYAGKEVLDILKGLNKNITIVSKNINDELIKKYNSQYSNIKFINNNSFHDRFIIIDNKLLYHCGSSFNDLGKKCFAISIIEDNIIINDILSCF